MAGILMSAIVWSSIFGFLFCIFGRKKNKRSTRTSST